MAPPIVSGYGRGNLGHHTKNVVSTDVYGG